MRPIAEFYDISRTLFESEIITRGEPAVLRGLCADWPAVRAGLEGDEAIADLLRREAADFPFEAWFGAPEIDGRFGYTADLTGFNHDRRLATVDQLLDLLLRQAATNVRTLCMPGGSPIRRHLPGLLPTLLDAPTRSVVRHVDLLVARQPDTDCRALGLAAKSGMCGRRAPTLHVIPNGPVENLDVGPLDFTLAGQPISLVDADAPDLERFPRFAEALDAAQSAELGPGDALYIPSLWWHAVASLDELGAMINFWWRDAEPPLLTPLNTLYHAVITMKNLPPSELAAWRVFFDHYIFAANGDPVEHLPQGARGILGRRTPELVARVKRLLLEVLSR